MLVPSRVLFQAVAALIVLLVVLACCAVELGIIAWGERER